MDEVSGGVWNRNDRLTLLVLAAIPLVIQLAGIASPHYGYFFDEFYYLACSKRLALGYVDHPPLATWILALVRRLLGESMLGIRILPLLAGSATVWLTGLLVRELRGGRFALVLATLATGLSPVLLALTSFYSMNAFEPLLWTSTVLMVVRVVRGGDRRLWLVVGMLAGLGVENKHTFAVFLLALAAAVALTRTRHVLLDRWLWMGVALAVLLVVPNIVWQVTHGWPSLEFYRNAQFLKNTPAPLVPSILTQILVMNPASLPLWGAGLYLLLARGDLDREGGRPSLRFLGVTFALLFVLSLASKTSRPDRIAAAYPMLLAVGGVALERLLRRTATRAAYLGLLVLCAAGLLPIVVPVLPPPLLARYMSTMGFSVNFERGQTSSIPQLLADRTGWESFINELSRVTRSLPLEDQKEALIYTRDYGHAAAIELWAERFHLPRVISSHNNYWLWSAGKVESRVLIAVGVPEEDLKPLYRTVELAATVKCEYCMTWRRKLPIRIARAPLVPLGPLWEKTKFYY